MALSDEISNATSRRTIIEFPDDNNSGNITSGFYSGSIQLSEILCSSDDINFGECNSSKFMAKISNLNDISNKKIHVYQQIGDYTVDIFTGYVDSAKEVPNRNMREIIAYDELYKKSSLNVSSWWDELFASGGVTVKAMRDSLLAYLGISQESINLVNDDIIINKPMESTQLAFGDVIHAICEINGVFGHINRAGQFVYISLSETPTSIRCKSDSSSVEEYTVSNVSAVKLISSDNDEGIITGTGDNIYTITGNILTLGLTDAIRTQIVTNLYNKIKNITYRPANLEVLVSNPTIALGDMINVTINSNTVSTYVLQNTLYGIQLFSQTIMSLGNEYRSEIDTSIESELSTIKATSIQLSNDIAKLQDYVGDISTILSVSLSNEFQLIPTDPLGNNGNYTGCSTTITVMYGNEDVTNDADYTISAYAITGNWILSEHEYVVTNMTSDAGYADIVVSYKGANVTKRFNIAKAKQGASGEGKGISTTDISYQYGNSATDAPTGSWNNSIPENTSNYKYLWTRTYITYTDNTDSVSYSVSSQGSSSNNYYVTPSMHTITKSVAGILDPDSITFNFYYTIGASDTVYDYNGYYKVYSYVDDAQNLVTSGRSTSVTIDNISSTYQKIVLMLYSDSNYSMLLDVSTVDIIFDSDAIGSMLSISDNQIYVDGSKILAGSITSSSINVSDLFSKNITFTGKITGGSDGLGGIIKSNNYSSSAGMQIDLVNGTITSPSFVTNIKTWDGNGEETDSSGLVKQGHGQIGGFWYDTNKIYGGDATTGTLVVQKPTANTTWVFAAGGKSHYGYSDCPFRVSKAGSMYAASGKVGAWNLSSKGLYNDTIKAGFVCPSDSSNVFLYAGKTTYSNFISDINDGNDPNVNMYFTRDGVIYASSNIYTSEISAPKSLQSGKVTITPSAIDTPTGKAVSFGTKMSDTPAIVCTAGTGAPGTVVTGVSYTGASTTGFTLYLTRKNINATTCSWIAHT